MANGTNVDRIVERLVAVVRSRQVRRFLEGAALGEIRIPYSRDGNNGDGKVALKLVESCGDPTRET